ncbi:hypothetical protein YPPY13_2545 [Yersinia pestis PY-13]|uniref:Uncharacterized protein n=4 Tax=Yersinia pseudotuberculosis complex TaxID=1649845 RepID=A0A0U1QYW2_YERP3|nr:hypothetical protein YpsIP31758_1975 [Yersinia pseudotuberculosis IP 31758]ABX87018.1 hypothetical protein YpAngola_A2339 [Yersinia pestis Angola]ADV98724.1 hypothetical protein YPC_2142 [Yersinia pestis biovar Medievalis str. Harbin 35]EDR31301.1 hypothetical protein YPIP275_1684 [Yersinia pestis biovar Orientalis str. IP275]EDR37596.1 hypothetical protein YpF1991016_2697 [Yersinia pestis biovar Orientalis str. F1991016]EDR44221.1 hypothetical protein YpE1979001_0544 [Yersinia pestis biova
MSKFRALLIYNFKIYNKINHFSDSFKLEDIDIDATSFPYFKT